MRIFKKAITSGMVAMALVACSDNESTGTAPQETSQNQQDTSQNQQQNPLFEKGATYSSLLEDNFISNGIAVDCFSAEYGLGPCGVQRDTLETGNVLYHLFLGSDRYVGCKQGDSTLMYYSIDVAGERYDVTSYPIHKKLISADENVINVFKQDCQQENGTYSQDDDGAHICTLPNDSTSFVYYDDPYWAKYTGTIINTCIDTAGECKENSVEKGSSDTNTKATATISKNDDNTYTITLHDVIDFCEISSGVVRSLTGDALSIEYDKSSAQATFSGCICTADRHFQVNKEHLVGAKYVNFKHNKFTIENPLER